MAEGNRCRYPLDPLVEVMDRLLDPGGCPWDREQDHRSLRPYVLEEAYEVVAAIDSGDPSKLRDELGDLLLQVVFHAALASREGLFDVNDVVGAITEKLFRRHPHVFGPGQAISPAAALRQWEDIKKGEASPAGEPRLEAHLPALMQARKLLERAARLGRPVTAAGETGAAGGDASGGAVTAAGPAAGEEAFGAALLALLEDARRRGVDAELALRRACAELAARLDARADR